MPDSNTLITGLSVLAVPITALFVMGVSQWNARKTKRIELESNRKLKLIELREQTAKMIREEKREVYLDVLRAYRTAVKYWKQMGEWSLRETLQVDSERIVEVHKSFQELIVQAELVASAPVYDLARRLNEAMDRCWQTHYNVNERLFKENAQLLDSQTRSPEQIQAAHEAIWEQVRAEIKKVFEEQNTEQLYVSLRNQIRSELGFLSLSPELVPTQEELESLSKDMNELN